jgi:hypothetical protein
MFPAKILSSSISEIVSPEDTIYTVSCVFHIFSETGHISQDLRSFRIDNGHLLDSLAVFLKMLLCFGVCQLSPQYNTSEGSDPQSKSNSFMEALKMLGSSLIYC